MGRCSFISGVSGLVLTRQEREFFAHHSPLGLIIFARNIASEHQLKTLIDDVRSAVGEDKFWVLIDQEGGRVQRLQEPLFPKLPAARRYGELYEQNKEKALRYAHIVGRFMAQRLREFGINVNCTPVLDVLQEGADKIIDDRSFGADPSVVAVLGRAHSEGHLKGGVLPVIKHIPGHGRAMCDSHLDLPVIHAAATLLDSIDFAPFRNLHDLPLAMTAHVILEAYDPDLPISVSKAAIDEIIRGEIGFDGFLMCDDVSMQALSGSIGERVAQVIAAGCDGALHCNGNFDEMLEVAENSPQLEGAAQTRFLRSFKLIEEFEPLAEADALAALGEDWAMA